MATREEGFTREISTIRVDLATVRERERHLGKQIRSLGDEIAQLEETLKVSHETESNLEILRLRVEPLYDVFTNLREGVQEKAEVLRDRAQIEQAGQGDLRDTIDKAREAVDAEPRPSSTRPTKNSRRCASRKASSRSRSRPP